MRTPTELWFKLEFIQRFNCNSGVASKFSLSSLPNGKSRRQWIKEVTSVPTFNVSVDHQGDRNTAVERLRQFSDIVRRDLDGQVSDMQEQWDDHGNLDFAFQAMGMQISGRMETNDTSVMLQGKIPFAALPFRGMIEQTIRDKIHQALETC